MSDKTQSPPALVGGVAVKRSTRVKKYTAESLQYRVKMAAQKLKDCFKTKSTLFAQAAAIIVTKGDITQCSTDLQKLHDDIQESYDALEAAGEHESCKDKVQSIITEIDSMIDFLSTLHAETPATPVKDVKSPITDNSGGSGANGENNGPQPGQNDTKTDNAAAIESNNGVQSATAPPTATQTDVTLGATAPPIVTLGAAAPPIVTQAGAIAGAMAPPAQAYYTYQGTTIPTHQVGGAIPQRAPSYPPYCPTVSSPSHQQKLTVNMHSTVSAQQPNANPLLQVSEPSNTLITGNPVTGLQSNLAGAQLLSPASNSVSNFNANDLQIAQMIQRSRMEVPKPSIFTGNPLKFTAWARSFHALIVQSGLPPSELFHYLKGCLGGDALAMIEQLEMQENPQIYEEAIAKLRREYGDPIVIANAHLQSLADLPHVPNNNVDKLKKFCICLESCLSAKELYPTLQILDFSQKINPIVAKLPNHMVQRWNRKVNDMYRDEGTTPGFKNLCVFVKRETDILTNPVICQLQVVKSKNDKKSDNSAKNATSFSTRTKESEKKSGGSGGASGSGRSGGSSGSSGSGGKGHGGGAEGGREVRAPKCFYCAGPHWMDKCEKVLKIDVEARQQFIRSNRLCFACLRKRHVANVCRTRLTCRICKRRHATILHQDNFESKRANVTQTAEDDNDNADSVTSANTQVFSYQSKVVSKEKSAMIVPVWLFANTNPHKKLLVYAALDTQSDTTFVLQKAVDKLDIKGKGVNLKLSTMGALEQQICSQKISDLAIQAYGGGPQINLAEVFTRDIMPNEMSHVPTPERVQSWPHLKFLESELSPLLDIDIALLVGYDCPKALMPTEVVAPQSGETAPYAIKTALGWSVVGPMVQNLDFSNCHVTVSYPVQSLETGQLLHHSAFVFKTMAKESISPAQVLNMFDQDFGSDQVSVKEYSQDDLEFLNIMKSGVKQKEARYEAPLPFRGGREPNLPSNRGYAEMRLKKQCQKMNKNEKYCADYKVFMKNIIDKGFAEEVPKNEVVQSGQGWYLSHHGVYHPLKPEKIRVVFDASALYGGTALNSHLLVGPDLINPLVGVLCRFRLGDVAVMCDVEQMFFQFHVTPHHRNFLKFLWFHDGNLDSPIVEFRMKSHVFGATSSPGVANYCLQQIAADYEERNETEAALFVKNNFYIYNGLLSVDTAEQAVSIVKQTKSMLAEGSLTLHKFVSSDRAVSEALRGSTADNVELPGFSSVERALGIQWHTKEDNFVFQIKMADKPYTRRGILSTVSSIFDPLGLISPCILVAKRLLQEICRRTSSWDEPLAQDIIEKYTDWVDALSVLSELSIPRCIKPKDFGKVLSAEIHIFSDASTLGYGACAYLRLTNETGLIHCALIFSKSRVLPSKTVTIPRLELNAALLGAKIGFLLRRELGLICYKNLKEFYWCDSLVALGYIKSVSKRFHTFVANRVQQIHELTNKDDWHHVTTMLNPADIASRGLSAAEIVKNDIWFKGPPFLYEKDITVPKSRGFCF